MKKIWLPEEYRSNKKEYDIALLELETPVKFNDETCKTIEPACLNEANPIKKGAKLIIVGFGRVNISTEEKSSWLLKGTVKKTLLDECRKKFKPTGVEIQENQICAHDKKYDTCQGNI